MQYNPGDARSPRPSPENFLDCMDSRKRPNSDVEICHNSMITGHLGKIAFRLGRRIAWGRRRGSPEAGVERVPRAVETERAVVENQPVTIEELRQSYYDKRPAIRARLAEFDAIRREAGDARLFEELVYCIFTAGASARMGLNAVERVRPHLFQAGPARMNGLLVGAHRYPRARAGYVVHTRNYLKVDCKLRLRERLDSFGRDADARRDYFARNPGIKGIGYKEASHYLRNIGYRGYAILDKHILRTLHEFGRIESPDPPATKKKYLAVEEDMRKFARAIKINFDELDLLLWSNKTGEILK
jgi:N-glycosylase/DNA lyase